MSTNPNVTVRVLYTNGPWFMAEKQVTVEQIPGALPVPITYLWVFKTNVTKSIFNGYALGQVFECEFQTGTQEDVYFYGETELVYAFSSHTH